jgi:hypothetical protein
MRKPKYLPGDVVAIADYFLDHPDKLFLLGGCVMNTGCRGVVLDSDDGRYKTAFFGTASTIWVDEKDLEGTVDIPKDVVDTSGNAGYMLNETPTSETVAIMDNGRWIVHGTVLGTHKRMAFAQESSELDLLLLL